MARPYYPATSGTPSAPTWSPRPKKEMAQLLWLLALCVGLPTWLL